MTARAKGAASAVAPARSSRHKSPRHVVQLPVTPAELAQFRAAAAEEGIGLGEWLRSAARAYVRMDEHGELTDKDWREIVASG